MEIDFLGLNSRKYSEGEGSKNILIDTANEGVMTSLSLSSSSSLDSHKEILNFSERKKSWEFPGDDKTIPSSSGSTICSLAPYNHENSAKIEQPCLLLVGTTAFRNFPAAGFLYDLNSAGSTNLRNIAQLPTDPPASLAMLYSPCTTPNVYSEPEKIDNTMYAAGNTRASGGYTPTVAMARRATLARFLEKRLHRMNQGRTFPLTGKSPSATNYEACERTIARSNKKWNNSLKRR